MKDDKRKQDLRSPQERLRCVRRKQVRALEISKRYPLQSHTGEIEPGCPGEDDADDDEVVKS
jgi:hypothetical protein